MLYVLYFRPAEESLPRTAREKRLRQAAAPRGLSSIFGFSDDEDDDEEIIIPDSPPPPKTYVLITYSNSFPCHILAVIILIIIYTCYAEYYGVVYAGNSGTR